ncbi:TPA: hypothetical protein ACPDRM_002202 [Pasteurella multocida]
MLKNCESVAVACAITCGKLIFSFPSKAASYPSGHSHFFNAYPTGQNWLDRPHIAMND